MPKTETFSMREYGAKHIPSELLEPIFACLLATWYDMVDKGSMTIDQLITRACALSAVASEAGATHCVLATQNYLGAFERMKARAGV